MSLPPPLRSLLAALVVGLALFGPLAGSARAAAPQAGLAEVPRVQPGWALSLKSGVAFWMSTQSFALEHATTPVVRLEADFRFLSDRQTIGAELVASTTPNANYGWYVGYFVHRAALWLGPTYHLWARWGFGLGNGPPILSKDLVAERTIQLHVQAGVDMGWWLLDRSLALGLQLTIEDLAAVGGVLALTWAP